MVLQRKQEVKLGWSNSLESLRPLCHCHLAHPRMTICIYIYILFSQGWLSVIYIYTIFSRMTICIYIYCFNSIKCNETYNRSYGGNITATKEHLGTMTTTDTPSFVIQLNSSFTSIIYHFIVVGIHIYI